MRRTPRQLFIFLALPCLGLSFGTTPSVRQTKSGCRSPANAQLIYFLPLAVGFLSYTLSEPQS